MGAEVALRLSRTYSERINATVAIGAIISNVTTVSNLLLAAGIYDTGLPEEKILEILRSYTGQDNVNVGQLYYGNFSGGNNIKGFISPFSGHLTEITDSEIIYETVQWFEQSFNG